LADPAGAFQVERNTSRRRYDERANDHQATAVHPQTGLRRRRRARRGPRLDAARSADRGPRMRAGKLRAGKMRAGKMLLNPREKLAMQRLRLATLATVLIAAPAFAAPSSTPPSSFGESIDVRVVNVEAVVTGPRGVRVPGLNAADFRLLVDGQEVPIDYFTEVAGGQAASSAPASGAPAASAAPAEAVGTNYLVYIDDQFSIQPRRDLVLEKLRADLGRLGPHDQMSILSFDGHHLTRVIDWTGDRQALEKAFTTAEERPSFGLLALAEMRSGEEAIPLRETGSSVVSMSWGIGIGMRAVVAAMRG